MTGVQTCALPIYVEVSVEEQVPEPQRRQAAGSATAGGSFSYTGGTDEQPSALYGGGEGAAVGAGNGAGSAEDGEPVPAFQQRKLDEHDQLGRNDPCWCGSGKKFKKCHGA